MTDKELGNKVIEAFYHYSKKYFPFATLYSLDELKGTVTNRRGGGPAFIESLGMSVRFAEMDDDKINNSMSALAMKSGGKIPSKNSDFYNFMINEATSVNFVDATLYTAKETAKTVVSGVEEVGNTLINTGKILNLIFIPVVLYFGYQFLKNKTK